MIELYPPVDDDIPNETLEKRELVKRIETIIEIYNREIAELKENMPRHELMGSARRYKLELALKVDFVRKLKRVLDPDGDGL